MATKKYRSFASKRIQKFTWKQSVDGGTKNTTISLGTLPANILVCGGFAVVNTQPVGSGTSISFGYTGQTTALYPSTAVTNLTANKIIKFLPGAVDLGGSSTLTDFNTAANMVSATRTGSTHGAFVLTAPKDVVISISNNADLSAGDITLFIEYYVL